MKYSSGTDIFTSFGIAGLVGIVIMGIIAFFIPLFIIGIYRSTKNIEKMIREYIDTKPKRIRQEAYEATHNFERREGSIYPEVKE